MSGEAGEKGKPVNPVLKAIGPRSTRSSDTLYERLGGEEKLDIIVTGVYNAMKADKEIGKQFARFRLERLKERTVDYLRGEWGGDEYKGSDLWISHSHLGVNDHWYDIMMKYYVDMCKKEKIPKKETDEMIISLEKMRGPIVDAGLKYKNMFLKYSEKLAEASGGDGWGDFAATQKERDAKMKTTLDMIQKQKEEEMMREEMRKMEEMDAKIQAMIQANKAEAQTTSGEHGSTTASSCSDRPKAKAKPKAKPKAKTKAVPKKPAVDHTRFNFSPLEDNPPADMPSSAPSGAELLYRLSRPCVGFSAAQAGLCR